MAWWHKGSKPKDDLDPNEVSFVYGRPGTIIPCDDPKSYADALQKVGTSEPRPDPEPDLSTKPEDVVGYCFGYVCPKKHVNSTFDSITVDGYKQRRTCNKCGAVAKPATVKRTAEARWGDCSYPSIGNIHPKPLWAWYNSYQSHWGKCLNMGETLWTKYEFVHYLESPKRRKK